MAASVSTVRSHLEEKQSIMTPRDLELCRTMAAAVLNMLPCDERTTDLFRKTFGVGVLPEASSEEGQALLPGARAAEGAPGEQPVDAPRKGFAVTKATEDEVREEAKIRMSHGLAIIRYLKNNPPELRRVLERLTLTHLQSLCSMHDNWVGGGERGRFKTPQALFQAVYPEAYEAGISEALPRAATVGRSAPRVQWHILNEEAQKEAARHRLFEGWPLIQELYEAQEWQALNELCGLLQTDDLKQWRINFEGMKGAGIKFATMKEFFPAVFPEAFTTSTPSSAADSSK